MDVASRTLEAIDAVIMMPASRRGAPSRLWLAQRAASAEQALGTADAAMQVAIGTLEEIDARDWEGQIARTSEEARAASALAAEALAAAEKALLAAKDAMDVASGTLEAIDARDYDARIESAAAAARATASGPEGVADAEAAMEVAVGTLGQ